MFNKFQSQDTATYYVSITFSYRRSLNALTHLCELYIQKLCAFPMPEVQNLWNMTI